MSAQHYNAGSAIERQLARIEHKLDKVADDHEGRIRKLERSFYTAAGIAMVSGATGVVSLLNIIFGGSS